MPAETLLYFIIGLLLLQNAVSFLSKSKNNAGSSAGIESEVSKLSLGLYSLQKDVARQETILKEELRNNRQEVNCTVKDNREEVSMQLHSFQLSLTESLNNFSVAQIEQLKTLTGTNLASVAGLNKTLEERISALVGKTDDCHAANRKDLSERLQVFSHQLQQKLDEVTGKQQSLIDTTVFQLDKVNVKLEQKLTEIITRSNESHLQLRSSLDHCFKGFSDTFDKNVKSFNEVLKLKFDEIDHKLHKLTESTLLQLEKIDNRLEHKLSEMIMKSEDSSTQMRTSLNECFKEFQQAFDRNVKSFNDLQREKFGDLEKKQDELVRNTEQKLERMRETVDEKLQKTLEARLGQSFELVSKQLESVQKGLGEMQTLAQDVGGLKKVLSNVKTRGTLGEIQLGNILEQILAPDQFDRNVKVKIDSLDVVEFAVKLPGRDDGYSTIYLPIDAKFPNDTYQQLLAAYDGGDNGLIDAASKNIEHALKKMAKDIRDKYINPPNTTDFAIMFLPTEGLYAEIIRRCNLMEQIQREYKVVVTGPTTLAAILNSLQMGFKTLAIQKRTSEVWRVLAAVKTEFEKFGGMLDKAQRNLQTASNQLDEVIGKRTRAIQKTLQNVELLPADTEAQTILNTIETELLDNEIEITAT